MYLPEIKWQEGSRISHSVNGLTPLEALELTRDRIKEIDNRQFSQYNSDTIHLLDVCIKIQEARLEASRHCSY